MDFDDGSAVNAVVRLASSLRYRLCSRLLLGAERPQLRSIRDDERVEVGGIFVLACFEGEVTELCVVGFLFCVVEEEGERVEEDGFASCCFFGSSTTTSLSSLRVWKQCTKHLPKFVATLARHIDISISTS